MKLEQVEETNSPQLKPQANSLVEQAQSLQAKADRSFSEDLELVTLHNQIQELSRL